MDDKCKQYKFKKHYKHFHWWRLILTLVALFFLGLAFVTMICPPGFLKNFFIKCNVPSVVYLWSFWFNIIEYLDLSKSILALIFALLPYLCSSIVLIASKKRKMAVIQLKTFFWHFNTIIMSLIFVVSLAITMYCLSENNNRVTAASFAFISAVIVSVYALLYFIRINTDNDYYTKEICNFIIFFHYGRFKIKPRLLKPYLHALLPNVSEEYNLIKNDIRLLEYFILKIKKDNITQEQGLKIIKTFLIPLTARMRRTYGACSSKFIYELISHFENIRVNFEGMNLMIRCYLTVIAREYLIEIYGRDMRNFHKHENDYFEKIENWTNLNENEYKHIYENYELGFSYNLCDELYDTYILSLDRESLINMMIYSVWEDEYVNERRIRNFDRKHPKRQKYGIGELLFINTYHQGLCEKEDIKNE